jgi:hypothetical protein
LHQIQYEEMVQSPEAVMKGICAFLQIPFDPRMASLEGADRSAIYEGPQHEGVKNGKKIGLDGKKPKSALSPEWSGKIARYIAYWKKESAGSWPKYPQSAGDAEPARLLERTGDEVYFRILRALDRFTAFVYCYAPIAVLRRYRSAKSRPRAVTKPENTVLSEAPNRN